MGIDTWRLQLPAGVARVADVELSPASALSSGQAPLHSDVPDSGWDGLRQQVVTCTRCDLHRSRTQTVFGVGNQHADWLIIGEAPGAEEDKRGEPFVGRAGQLLDAMLAAISLDRTQAYIANILKCRPPNNRDPQAAEVACCEPYLQQQIALLKPKLILAVGRIAAQNLLKTDLPLGRLRGQTHHYGENQIPVIVTYHPAYLLRTPSDKRKAWEDLKLAVRLYRQQQAGAAS
ncbi:MAG: uracil-DNA glycosylase [Gammaproteobacteria bacterium]|nr:uracil-DNA glycosylase [Gammaproteobacteria bacterium]MBU2477945.1 uracil-DNA glycosylase [Gammaproteobacteria bacterium]